MEAPIDIHPFAYRAPRFAVTLPIEFVSGDVRTQGVTKDLSENGMQAWFDSAVLVGAKGRVRLKMQSCSIELAAEIAHAELREAGLRFAFDSEAERAFVRMLARVLSRTAGKTEMARQTMQL